MTCVIELLPPIDPADHLGVPGVDKTSPAEGVKTKTVG
jgi:hypothetical protein